MINPKFDLSESERVERWQAFFDGETVERDSGGLSIGGTCETICARNGAEIDDAEIDAAIAEIEAERQAGAEIALAPEPAGMAKFEAALEVALAKRVNDDETTSAHVETTPALAPAPAATVGTSPAPVFAVDLDEAELEAAKTTPAQAPAAERVDNARIYDTPIYDELIYDELILTRADKARRRIRAAESLRDGAEPDSADYHEAMAELAEAKRVYKHEIKRDGTDIGRKQNNTDLWRSGEGRDVYNASRRKTRSSPNARRHEMTPEQRTQHDADMNAKRQWTSKKRKAGWTEERIEAELPGWWVRRTAKRPCG